MKSTTLNCIALLLNVLRAHPALDEVRPAAFHFNGRDFIHFHEEPEGIFADVRLAKGRVRMPVSTRFEQAELLESIERKLSLLESHAPNTRTRKRQRRE
jgi:hypothetical protein